MPSGVSDTWVYPVTLSNFSEYGSCVISTFCKPSEEFKSVNANYANYHLRKERSVGDAISQTIILLAMQ